MGKAPTPLVDKTARCSSRLGLGFRKLLNSLQPCTHHLQLGSALEILKFTPSAYDF